MELYLSRIILNPTSKAVMHDLGSPRELHKTLSGCFPKIDGQDGKPSHERKTPRNVYDLLHRLDQKGESAVLYIQSNTRPDWHRLSPGYAIRYDDKKIDHLYTAIKNGDRLQFRLAANPTKRAGKSDDGKERFRDPKKRRRIDIRTEEGRIKWLARKGEECGFRLAQARISDDVVATEVSTERGSSFKHDNGRVTLGSAVFTGVLEVTDADAFRNALAKGIGPGKAYGFGLMSIARA
jgi:CRISPR system Cascade subunit CasE